MLQSGRPPTPDVGKEPTPDRVAATGDNWPI